MADIKVIRVGADDADPVNLLDRTRYEYASNDSTSPHQIFDRETRALRGQDGSQLVKSQLLASECSIRVYCVGATIQDAEDNESRIIEHLAKAEAFSLPGRKGSKVELVDSIRNQLEPGVYTIQYGEWRPQQEELKAANIIAGDIFLRLSPIPVATTATTRTSPILCNYDTWTFPVEGSQPVDVNLSVEMLGAAAHYDRVRVSILSDETINPDNHIWPFEVGNLTPPTGYTVELDNAGRVSGVDVTLMAKGTGQFQLIWRTGGGDVVVAGPIVTGTDGAAYQSYVQHVTVNPATELPFTVVELNAGQWGIKKVGAVAMRVTQIIMTPLYVPRDTLELTGEDLLATGTGASDAWAKNGAANAWDCVNDAVGADDGDTTYLSSSTDGQVTLLTFPVYTVIDALDTGVTGWVTGVGGFQNGGMEEPYSGPTFGPTLLDEPITSNAGWVPRTDVLTFMGYNADLGGMVVSPVPGAKFNGFAMGNRGGLTPGKAVRLQIDMRCQYGVPVGQGAQIYVQDGGDRGYALFHNSSVWTTKYFDFVPLGEAVGIFLMVNGSITPAIFRNLKIREVSAVASRWSKLGTVAAVQEKNTSGLFTSGVAIVNPGYVYDGLSAQAVGPGDPTNAIQQTIGVIDGESYRVVSRARAHGMSIKYGGNVPGMNVRVVSGSNEDIQTTFDNSQFERLESVVIADGDTMTIQAYANEEGAGWIDGLYIQRIDEATDHGAVALRVTITQDVVDHYGPHQIWARIKVEGEPVAVSVRYGGDDGQLAGGSPVIIEPSSHVRIARLGAVMIPPTATNPDAPIESFTFSIILQPAAASDVTSYISFDRVELFPAQQIIIAKNAEDRGAATNQRQVFDGGSQTTYIANSGGSTLRTTAQIEGAYLRLQPGTNRLFVRVSRSEEDDRLCPEDTFRLRITYTAAGHIKHRFSAADLISNYHYWFRSYDLAGVDGGNADTWPDLSGHGRDAVYGIGAHSVLVDGELPGGRIVRMTGSVLHFPEIALPTAQIFIVAKVDTAGFQGTMLRTSATPGPNYGIGVNDDFGDRRIWVHMYSDNNSGPIKHSTSDLQAIPAEWAVYTILGDYAEGELALLRDGVDLPLGADSTGTSAASGIDPDGHVHMDVAQIIIASGLTTQQVSDLVSFLITEAGF